MIEGSFNSQSISQLRQTALNRDHPGPGQVLFNRIDQNDSGGLDFDEILALVDKTDRGSKLLENFDRVDQDESGELSFREIKSFFKGMDLTV
jgi:Ca2+-binding EF-hand superfamily protein